MNVEHLKGNVRVDFLYKTSQKCTGCGKVKRLSRFYDRPKRVVNEVCNKCAERISIIKIVAGVMKEEDYL